MPSNEAAAKSHGMAKDKYKKTYESHDEAEKAYKSGDHQKGAHHATNARGHAAEGDEHAEEAFKSHAKAHGDKK